MKTTNKTLTLAFYFIAYGNRIRKIVTVLLLVSLLLYILL